MKIKRKKASNEVINQIAEDFEKLAVLKKSKELKRYAEKTLPNYKKWKIHNQK